MINIWVSKKGDVRKREFIETAIKIFKNKGYEKASINDILKQMNVTKGAFYYYFESKEALLNEIIDNLTQGIQTILNDIMESNELSAVTKLEQIFYATNQYRKDNKSSYHQLYEWQKREENAFIARKFMEKALSVNVGYIQSIINQGIKEGIFETSNPREMAELYIRLTSLCKEKVAGIITDTSFLNDNKAQYENVKDIITFYQETLERMLGAKNGTLGFFIKSKFEI